MNARPLFAMFAPLVFALGCAQTDAGTSGRILDTPGALTPEAAAAIDAGLTAKVKTKLLADPNVGGLKIDVDTRDRIVTLIGTVDSDAEKARAAELAGQIENVTRVDNRLTVRPRNR